MNLVTDTLQLGRPYYVPLHTLDDAWSLTCDSGWAIMVAGILAVVAVVYAEILYTGTLYMYKAGWLKRYGPLPSDRNVMENWSSAFAFITPSVLWATIFGPVQFTFEAPNIVQLYIWTVGYMVFHDTLFYLMHRTFHANMFLYRSLHAMHHEYSKAMNVYTVGYAEITENLLQVGLPWLLWTMWAGRSGNIWLTIMPLSVTLYTTLMGHGGYKMHPACLIFHPFAALILVAFGVHVLTPGDHQMHHVYRKCNMSLFFRWSDRLGGTFRRSNLQSHDAKWWAEEIHRERSSPDFNAHKTKVAYHLVEVPWGF